MGLCLSGCSYIEHYAFRKGLSATAKILNTQCPQSFPYGSLERVFMENDTLCTLVRINESLAEAMSTFPELGFKTSSPQLGNMPVRAETASAESGTTAISEKTIAMTYFLLSLAEDTTRQQLNDVFRGMAAHDIWLRMRLDSSVKVKDATGGRRNLPSIWLYASPALLDSVFNGRFSVKEAARIGVQMQVLMAKRKMPITLNDQLKMTAIDYTPGLVTMAYTVSEDELVNLGKEDFRTTAEIYVRQRIWKDLIGAKKAATQDVVKDYYLAGCKVRYTCTGATTGGHLEILFTQGDLRMLLSHYGIHL